MRILITGATSMIGSALIERLAHDGHRVIAVVRTNAAKTLRIRQLPFVEIVHCDMDSYGNFSRLISDSVDAAVLMAWNGTRGKDRMDAAIQQQNEVCNASLLPELAKLGCHMIMTAGSQAEYGPLYSEQAQTEDMEPHPNTEYGKSKLRFYQMADSFCREQDIRLIEPRFFSLYGPDDNENTLIMSLLRSMLRNEPCKMTSCVQLWDFLYIDDAVDGLVKLLTKEHLRGIYNFGSGDSRPLKEYIEEMYRMTGSRSSLLYGAIPYPETGMVSIHPSVDRLRATGWAPKVRFADGIDKIITAKYSDEKRM